MKLLSIDLKLGRALPEMGEHCNSWGQYVTKLIIEIEIKSWQNFQTIDH
jgi:hypothetical protein